MEMACAGGATRYPSGSSIQCPRSPSPAPSVITQRPSARHTATSTRDAPPTLIQFVVLSMLLHLLVVILFGTTPGGSASRGEQLLGVLDVTLRRLTPDVGSGIRLSPGAATTAPGTALLPRPESAARPAAPSAQPPAEQVPSAPAPEPAAASAAEPSPSPPNAAPAPPAPVSPPTETTPSPPVERPAFEVLPRLDLTAPEIVDKPLTPARPSKIERRTAPPAAPATPPREMPFVAPTPIERVAPEPARRELAVPIAPPPREVPFAAPAPVERIAPERTNRELAAPIEPPPRELPFTAPAPLERVAPEKAPRELVAPVEPPPREVPFAAPAPIERIAPERARRELAAPIEPPPNAIPAPAPVPRAAPVPLERETGRPVEAPATRPAAVDAAPPAGQAAPMSGRESPPAATTLPRSEPAGAAPRGERATTPAGVPQQPGTREAPASAGVPAGEAAPRQRPGTPDVDGEVFRPRPDTGAPAPAAGDAPRIDLDATRRRAREITSERPGSSARPQPGAATAAGGKEVQSGRGDRQGSEARLPQCLRRAGIARHSAARREHRRQRRLPVVNIAPDNSTPVRPPARFRLIIRR